MSGKTQREIQMRTIVGKGDIANTTKGKGVSYMENQAGWHGKAPNQEQFDQAMEELQATYAKYQ